MSDEKASKFGVLKGLQQSSKAVNSHTQPAPEELPIQEVRFTNYLDAEVSRRLQIHVAQLKARKVRGGERVSIKSVLHQALVEYLERHDG
ncbi:hypothetical protein Q0M94_26365 (plasmid) [Deinococcus radiomollis]|uniref:hypothetical protein n=1 Tax=Deinococcus radiomollis TaxID=468916 RepID=UPI0038923AD2